MPEIIHLGVLCGTLTSLLCIGGLCLLFRLDRTMTVSLLPKSVTTAIGAPVSEAMGGLGAVTVTAIIATGILANIFGQTACRLLLGNIGGDTKIRKEIVPQKLVIRDTSAKRK